MKSAQNLNYYVNSTDILSIIGRGHGPKEDVAFLVPAIEANTCLRLSEISSFFYSRPFHTTQLNSGLDQFFISIIQTLITVDTSPLW